LSHYPARLPRKLVAVWLTLDPAFARHGRRLRNSPTVDARDSGVVDDSRVTPYTHALVRQSSPNSRPRLRCSGASTCAKSAPSQAHVYALLGGVLRQADLHRFLTHYNL